VALSLKKLLGAEDGWGVAAGTLLLLGFGLFVLFVSLADLKEASRLQPVERGCSEWLSDPSGARWVKLVGCKLDFASASSRKWRGFVTPKDGGTGAERYLELFVPIVAGDVPDDPPRAVLATRDEATLDFVNGIERLAPEDVPAYLEKNRATIDAIVEPKTLVGYVEPMKSLASRSALGQLMAPEAVVLEQGRQPPRANALFGLLIGLVSIALVSRSVFRRWLVERDSSL
jgi:hypothetical protein